MRRSLRLVGIAGALSSLASAASGRPSVAMRTSCNSPAPSTRKRRPNRWPG